LKEQPIVLRNIRTGFTLIELLIVVAIIAILAAIAVPNFLEAQTRAKVSRVKSDLRTMATGLESYNIDFNGYPPCNSFGVPINSTAPGIGGSQNWAVLERLSTPVAYLTDSLFKDAFVSRFRTGSVYTGNDNQPGLTPPSPYPQNDTSNPVYQSYQYHSTNDNNRALLNNTDPADRKAFAWVMGSAGPDLTYLNMGGVLANNSEHQDGRSAEQKRAYSTNLLYDPTNGTVSFGEIFRAGGNINGRYARYFYETVASSGGR
jgi:prepilin-type N-terminal cleavage/methylation domain-containing protein